MSTSFQLHPQLAADCHQLGQFPEGLLLLHGDAALLWLILVPFTDQEDYLDLPAEQRQQILQRCGDISQFVKAEGFAKVNFAAIGNVVSQMHLHIVGRSSDDPAWPAPVWGNLNSGQRYSESQIASLIQRLQSELFLQVN